MPVITLTTDLGYRDAYLPSVKGYILSRVSGIDIVDISHAITPFRIAEASFVVASCYEDFPEGTIHIVSVESSMYEREYVAVEAAGHYFLAQDNGIISLILGDMLPTEIVSLSIQEKDLLFPLKNILAPAACRIAQGEKPGSIGEPRNSIMMRSHLRPMLQENKMVGNIVYIDVFGNCVSNIHQLQFEDFVKNRRFKIFFSPRLSFEKLRNNYGEVAPGEAMCMFSGNGWLEFSINQGNASKLLGLAMNSNVIVELN